MKKLLICVLAVLLLASGCQAKNAFTPKKGEVCVPYKILAVYESSVLAYACEAEYSELTFVSLSNAALSDENGTALTPADLKGGMVIEVIWNGMVAESWPSQIWADRVRVREQQDDRVGLYRTVLNNLWEADPALRQDAQTLGLDFSTLTHLTEMEKTGLAYLFSCDVGLGLQYVFGTWEELCDEGYIDRENLCWEDGVFFSLTLQEEGADSFVFDAEMWRSGTGAIQYSAYTAKRGGDGQWRYEPGRMAMA